MNDFKVLAGDFGSGDGWLGWNDQFRLPRGGQVPSCLISRVEIATQENVKRIGGTVGWTLVGGALFGPLGAVAGFVMGGKNQNIVFTVEFRDGKRFLATGNTKTYTAIQAASMDAPRRFEESLHPKPKRKSRFPKFLLYSFLTLYYLFSAIFIEGGIEHHTVDISYWAFLCGLISFPVAIWVLRSKLRKMHLQRARHGEGEPRS
jgi:hypothetical protein